MTDEQAKRKRKDADDKKSPSPKKAKKHDTKDAIKKKTKKKNRDKPLPDTKTTTNDANNDNSQKSNSAVKRELKQARQSQRRHADVVSEAKRLWNQLREKSNTPKQNRLLMDQLMPLMTGKIKDIALQHDAARVVQAALQFGTLEERRTIVQELTAEPGTLAEMSKPQYSHFCVLKVIKYCHNDADSLRRILRNLRGHMTTMAVHAVAAQVVESLFTTLPAKKYAVLKKELYGPHVAIFDDETNPGVSLGKVLETVPDKKDAVLDFIKGLLSKGMTKTFYALTFFQDLLADYCSVASGREIRTFVAATAVDHVVHLLSSRAGARVVVDMISYGTPKDRKTIIKGLKGSVRSALVHRDAYLALVRLVQLTDDTVLLHKSLLSEVLAKDEKESETSKEATITSQHPLLEVCLSPKASKFLLEIIVNDADVRKKIFDPNEKLMLIENPTIVEKDAEGGKEVAVPTSKKDPPARRKELMQHLKQPLLDVIAQHTNELVRSIPGSMVVKEVYREFPTAELAGSIVNLCEASFAEGRKEDASKNKKVEDASEKKKEGKGKKGGGKEESVLSLMEDPVAHRTLKNLIMIDTQNTESKAAPLAAMFVSKLKSHLQTMVETNRGAFVLAALCKREELKKTISSTLKLKKLKALAADDKKPTAGLKALIEELEG